MSIRADDGTILEAKEGVVLDEQGRQLTSPRPSVRSFSFSLPLPAIIAGVILLPLALATGFAFFTVIGVLLLAFAFLNFISRIFRHP